MATAGFGPPPTRGGEEESSSGSAQQMVGQEAPGQGSGNKEQQNLAFASQVKRIHTSLDDLSRQYPAFASYARKAQEACKEGMVRTLSEMQSQPAESSSLPGMG